MLSTSPRIWALKSSSIWKASNTENHDVVASLATPAAYISKNQRIIVFRLIQYRGFRCACATASSQIFSPRMM